VKRRGWSEEEREDADDLRLGGTKWKYRWLCGGQSETNAA
jgi:hypothetical protein